MNLIVVGTNHKYSPIELRERISFPKKRLNDALLFLREQVNFSGQVILSTCNRVEIYASSKFAHFGISCIEDFFSIYHEINKERLTPYLYRYINEEAINHLFRVSCGLDSQVLGETQILGQLNFFYKETKRFGFTDRLIDTVFNKTIEIGKLVRVQTKVSSGNISIGSVAINLIKREFAEFTEKKLLLIGAGETSELVSRYLLKENINTLFVTNRTHKKAKKIAKSIGAKPLRFDRLKEILKSVDIVISATASPHVILRKEDLVNINKPLLILDLAVPRDIDPGVREIKGVRLFDLDDLNSVIEENISKRKIEAKKVSDIIDREVNRLWKESIGLELEEVLLP